MRGAAWLPDLAYSLLLFGFALAVRFPNFMTVPALTDEFKEVGWALKMIQENSLPLVAVDSYDGPLFAWVLSFLFRVFGQNLYLPRGFVLVVGALTVTATYFLGKQLSRGDRRVGALAAILLSLNAHHILFNSHVAWSNDTTPFFATLSILSYLRATRGSRPAWLIAAGAMYGLALQTHPSVLALAPAFVVDAVVSRSTRDQLRSRFGYLGFLAALIAYSPLLIYNLTTGFASIEPAASATYAFELHPSIARTLGALVPTIGAIGRVAFGSMQNPPGAAPWVDLTLVPFLTITITSLVWLEKRHERFVLIAVLVATVFLATFNRFRFLPDSARYFEFILPLLFSAWSALAIGLWDQARELRTRKAIWLSRAGIGIVFALISAFSMAGLVQYYKQAQSDGRTNVAMLGMVEGVRPDLEGAVLIEHKLNGLRTGRGGNVADDLLYLFQLDRRATRLVSLGDQKSLSGLQSLMRRKPTGYLVAFPDAPQVLGDRFRLTVVTRGRFPCPSCQVSNDFFLFRWEQSD